MEEVSSLDSFHTDEVEESETVEKTETEEVQSEKVNEDFEQVSSDEFENEENSVEEEIKETSQNEMEVQEEAAVEGEAEQEADVEGDGEGEGDVEEAEVEECEDDVDEATQHNESADASTSADFEEVDANTSSQMQHSNAAEESDMLGDNDMTLGNAADEAEGEGEVADEAEVDADADGDVDDKSTNTTEVENMGEDEQDPEESNDVEMASNESSPASVEKSKNQQETTDHTEVEATADESLKAVEDEGNDVAEDKSNDNDDNEDEGEHGADTVENVQEPEESDVCLIPDDTEAQVTEAEKEQAILARENAEKEDVVEDSVATIEEEEKEQESSEKDATDNVDVPHAEEANNDSSSTEPVKSTAVTEDVEAAEEEVAGDSNEVVSNKTIISWMVSKTTTCSKCETEKLCEYRYKVADEDNENEDADSIKYAYLCTQECCTALTAENPGKYFIRRKKFLVEEMNSTQDETENEEIAKKTCVQCKDDKVCKLFFKQDDDNFYICSDECFELLNTLEPEKFKLKRHSIRVRNIGATLSTGSKQISAESHAVARTAAEAEAARQERMASFTRRCAECLDEVTLGEKSLLWESMDFCNELCLGKYQRKIGSHCQTCNGEVPHQALGKYCVRFGFDVKQFCCAPCLNEYKKGLKTCSCCQKDISKGNEGFLAPVGDKEQFKDFCSQTCMRRYDNMCNPIKKLRNDCCAVCNNEKPVRVEIVLDNKEYNFCSNPCFSAFKFVSNIVADQCGMCCKYFERKGSESFTIYTEKRAKVFCSKICLNVFIIVNRRIVSCQWCKVKKYNFDMIYNQRDGQEILMCSLNCLTLYGVSITAFTRTIIKCDNCNTSATPQYHLTMSDTSMRNFCTYQCVMQFQNQFSRTPLTLESDSPKQATSFANKSNNNAPFPTGLPKRIKLRTPQQVGMPKQMQLTSKMNASSNKLPVISTVSSLATGESETHIGSVTVRRNRTRSGRKIESPPSSQLPPPLAPLTTMPTKGVRLRKGPLATLPTKNDYQRTPSPSVEVQIQTETKIITVPPLPPKVRNIQTSCKPQQITVGLQVGVEHRSVGCQTDKDYSNKVLIPVPVPIYVPQPMYMYSAPFPVPVPIPLPIPVPIFIPTTRNSAQGILKEIKKIQDKMPADPFEAELLMMAEMVAEEKAESDSDSAEEPEDIKPTANNIVTIAYGNNNVDTVEVGGATHANHGYGEDVLQMALKMATGDYDAQPTVDLESAMTANTITNPPPGIVEHHDDVYGANVHMHTQQIEVQQRPGRGRKRGSMSNRSPVKRQRLQEIDGSLQQQQQQQQPLTVNTHMLLQNQQELQPMEKPDAAMCLKYTFGVNAWRQWVMTKNAEIEKSSMRRRPFKTDLLQMTADELNYSLCLFIKEVRKPNGAEYAPDTIYYLVLGLQQYLYENGRIDNIFTDSFYERFTDCLDDVARKFSVLYNDSQYIVTRVEEEHLWECKQLGAHSPHVLLSTLMFFNTKHFNLTTVEEHMQLSFSHIMKHWKRSGQSAKVPGTRNVLLRFYPPQTGLDANPRKKKVYEQQENEENPLRCPVRLYEFYLSKCPESVKTRNDVFYLQPERSCVPDSPVWYSTQALSQDSLQKMLHRVKMVKEINIALLTS